MIRTTNAPPPTFPEAPPESLLTAPARLRTKKRQPLKFTELASNLVLK